MFMAYLCVVLYTSDDDGVDGQLSLFEGGHGECNYGRFLRRPERLLCRCISKATAGWYKGTLDMRSAERCSGWRWGVGGC